MLASFRTPTRSPFRRPRHGGLFDFADLGADGGKIVGGQRFSHQQQLNAFFQIRSPSLEDLHRAAKLGGNDLPHGNIDFARGGLGGMDAIDRHSRQYGLRRRA